MNFTYKQELLTEWIVFFFTCEKHCYSKVENNSWHSCRTHMDVVYILVLYYIGN